MKVKLVKAINVCECIYLNLTLRMDVVADDNINISSKSGYDGTGSTYFRAAPPPVIPENSTC